MTVIISTYQRARFVGRAITSVLAQTFQNFELLVVDDYSLDNTQEVVHKFKDSRIKYIRHTINKGGPAARNTGIEASQGRYIAFLDDDDQWMATKLEKQVRLMEQSSPCVGLIYVGAEVVDENDAVVSRQCPQDRGNVQEVLLMGSFFGSVTKALVKSECFDKVGRFDEELRSCQDWDMWKRIADYYEVDFVSEILAKIYLHDVQISSNFNSLILGRTRMVKKHWGDFKKHPKIFVIHLKRLGKLHCLNGTWKEAFYWFKEAVKVNKLEVIKILAWCVIEMPWVKFCARSKGFKRC